MKILFISHQADFIFGGEICTLALMEELQRKGISVHFASPPGPYRDLAARVATVHDLPSIQFNRRVHMLPRLLPALLRTNRALKKIVVGESIDVVHTTSLKAMVYAWRLAKKFKVCWHHHDILPSRFRNDIWVRALAKRAAAVFTPSEATAAALIEADVPKSKVHVLYNGFVVSDWKARAPRKSDMPLKFAMVGEISKRKGSDLLPSLVALLEHSGLGDGSIELHIVGKALSEPELEIDLRRQLAKVAWVKFHGRSEAVATLLQEMDVLLVLSRQDPLPTVIVEAQLSGLPCVGTKVGGIPEMIQEGKNGYLVQSVPDIAQIIPLLRDVDNWTRLSANARASAEEKFNISQTAQKLLQLYQRL